VYNELTRHLQQGSQFVVLFVNRFNREWSYLPVLPLELRRSPKMTHLCSPDLTHPKKQAYA